MPFPNEHSCRLQNPDQFSKLRREKRGKLIVIYGKRPGKDTTEEQSYHYPTDGWTEDEARITVARRVASSTRRPKERRSWQ